MATRKQILSDWGKRDGKKLHPESGALCLSRRQSPSEVICPLTNEFLGRL